MNRHSFQMDERRILEADWQKKERILEDYWKEAKQILYKIKGLENEKEVFPLPTSLSLSRLGNLSKSESLS